LEKNQTAPEKCLGYAKIHTSLTHFVMKNSKFAKLGGFIVNAARV
jgi:hypothetical protein